MHFVSYPGLVNPTSEVVDFSVWHYVSDTHFLCISFKLQGRGTRIIIYHLLFELNQFMSVSGGLL